MSTQIPIVVATRNQKKCRELGDLLIPWGIQPAGVWQFPGRTGGGRNRVHVC